jgi:hypothetical protein
MVQRSIELTHSSSSSPAGGGGPYFGGMVSRKQRATQAGFRLVKQNARPNVETHTVSSVLPRFYEYSTYTACGNWSPV